MKLKLFVFISFLVFLCLSAITVDAQTPTVAPSSSSLPTAYPSGAVRDVMKKAQEEFKTQRTEAREEFKAQIQQQKTLFRTRLAAIKDAKKKELVERIDLKIGEVNKTATARVAASIAKLEEILARIKTKGLEAKAQGKNMTSFDAAVVQAEAALTAAKTALEEQQNKEYVVELGAESALKNTVGTSVSEFRADLKSLYKTVQDAKQAVMGAARELAKLMGLGGMHNDASGSASQVVPTVTQPVVTVAPTVIQ